MGSSCCKNPEKNDDKPPLPALEIAPKESGPTDPVDTTEMKPRTTDVNVSASLSVSTNPPPKTPKLTKSSGKSLSQPPIGSMVLTVSTMKSQDGIVVKVIDYTARCLDPLDTTEEDAKRKSTITADSLSRALSKFASDLYSKIQSCTNVVFSPLSITLAMALLEQGASGKAREEILALICPKPASNNHKSTTSGISDVDCGQLYGDLQEKILQFPKEHGQLCIANSVFLDIDYSVAVRESFLQSVKKYFKNETIYAPFWTKTKNARQQVNQWVSEKTRGKIPAVIGPDSLKRETVVLLVNAIYMKVDWEQKFDVARTKEGTFYRGLGRGEQKAKFMCGDGGLYMGRKDYHAVELPYKGGTMSMYGYIILPRDRDGIKELEKKINADFLMDIFANTRSHIVGVRVDVRMEIPKFTMRFKTSLLPALDKLGFRTLNELERMFDRSCILDNRRILEIKDIVHEAYIKVDEKGTEATAVVIMEINAAYVSIPILPPYVSFVADHPFLFVIVHKPTWSVMFMGKVESVEKE